jgi:ribonuclease Z
MPSANRSGPCVAIVAGRTLFVVDAGTNGVRNLQGVIGWPPGRIAAVLLTHYHSDHIDGLGEMGTPALGGGNHRDPLPLYGPSGLVDVAAGFERAYQFDAKYRVAHHGPAVVPPEGNGFAPHEFEAPAARRIARADRARRRARERVPRPARAGVTRGRLPLRLRRPFAGRLRRHEEVGQPARTGTRRPI